MKTTFLVSIITAVALATFLSNTQAATVFPIATNGIASQAGIFAAFGGTNYLVGIQGDGTGTVVEACTSLANPTWTPLLTGTLTNGSLYFSDPAWTNYSSRFYRISAP
ncbi:MAG: hypothetical protein ABSE16_03875 [Verrucomicrobiota bacterium]|jgi:hypothetical protein